MKTGIVCTMEMVMGNIQVGVQLWPDDVTNFGVNYVYLPKTGISSPEDLRSQVLPALTTYLNANGYNAPDNFYWAFDGEIVPASRTSGFAAVATSGSYNDLTSKPTIAAIQKNIATTNSSGVYTWTFSTAFPGGYTPTITATAVNATSGVQTNVQLTAVSNTAVSVQANNITAVLGILGLTSASSVVIHMTAQ